jgi:SEC-C motif-containing protein
VRTSPVRFIGLLLFVFFSVALATAMLVGLLAGLFCGYVATAVFLLAYQFLASDVLPTLSSPSASSAEIVDRLTHTNKLLRALFRARRSASTLLLSISRAIVWPATLTSALLLVRGLPASSPFEWVYRRIQRLPFNPPELKEFGLDAHASIFTLSAIVVIFAANIIGVQEHIHTSLLLLILFSSIFTRHLSYILAPGSLLRMLRLASRRPQVLFTALFVCDLAALALLLPVVAMDISPSQVSIPDIWQALIGVLPHKGWSDLLTGSDFSKRTVVINVSGMVFDAAVITSFFVGSTVGRTNTDLEELAIQLVDMGRLEEAKSTLGRLTQRTPESHMIEAYISLSSENIDDAKKAIEQGLDSKNHPHSLEFVYTFLFMLMQNIASLPFWRAVFQKAIQDGLRDPELALGLMGAFGVHDDALTLELFGGEHGMPDYVSRYSISIGVVLRILDFRGFDVSAAEQTYRSAFEIPSTGAGRFVHGALCGLGLNRNHLIMAVPLYRAHIYGKQLDELERLVPVLERLEDDWICANTLMAAGSMVHVLTPQFDERMSKLLGKLCASIEKQRPEEARLPARMQDLQTLMRSRADADEAVQQAVLRQSNSRQSIKGMLEGMVGVRGVSAAVIGLRDIEIDALLALNGEGEGLVHFADEVKRIVLLQTDSTRAAAISETPSGLRNWLRENVERQVARRKREFGATAWSKLERAVLVLSINHSWEAGTLSNKDIWFFLAQWISPPVSVPITKTPGILQLAEQVTGQLLDVQLAPEADDDLVPLPTTKLSALQTHQVDPFTGEDELELPTTPQSRPRSDVLHPKHPSTWGNVARNAPCPCGSGKKYKHCHGRQL